MNKLLVICGPTATGKTALAAGIAKQFNGELVSADSRQVYRGNDLETNKERPDVPIWLYDVVDQGEEFSVAHWLKLARVAAGDILRRGKLPIVVGGSGLYIHALLHPLETVDIPPDENFRKRNLTLQELQHMTSRGSMNDSDWNNPRRLIRKIEIAKSTAKKHISLPYDALIIGLTAPLPVLYKRIDDHLQERIRAGMNKENIINEHAIARKQLTWFKKQKGIHWFDVTDSKYRDKVAALVAAWYTTGAYVPED
ncbi:MAG: tRNA (adenosine(37)-N6)-dimethylallyltransferase MiaA [Candidatus Gottesmanbacteria bacterium]|nr:tRNA (adenosine(37)-N6)-dimethylallyltransferase MiaA [Candidatus Gottesmanbacteria bacterium]